MINNDGLRVPDFDEDLRVSEDNTVETADRNIMSSDTTDNSFLIEVVRRSPLLVELLSKPAGANELVEELDLSRSTIHRATDSLTEMNLIEKSDGTFHLTSYGEVVAVELAEFRNRMLAIRTLEPFLAHVRMPDIPVEHFEDADVIQPKPRQPHYSIRRIMELIEETERLRVFSTVISPFYVEIAHREMLNGMYAEAIFDEQTINIVMNEYEDQTLEAIESGRFEVYIHNNLPFELFLFDEKIGMAAHDENGIARVLVVTSNEKAVAWGEELYNRYLAEAYPISSST